MESTKIRQKKQSNKTFPNKRVNNSKKKPIPQNVFQLLWVLNDQLRKQIKSLPNSQTIRYKTKLSLSDESFLQTQQQLIPFQNSISFTFSYFTLEKLKILSFSKFCLNNCQFLRFFQLPVLQTIILSNNVIHNLKPMKRSHLPSLKRIEIEDILISELDLSRVNFQSKIQVIKIQTYSFNRIIGEDLSFIAKLNAKKIDLIQAESKLRINQEKKLRSLNEKYPMMGIYFDNRYFSKRTC